MREQPGFILLGMFWSLKHWPHCSYITWRCYINTSVVNATHFHLSALWKKKITMKVTLTSVIWIKLSPIFNLFVSRYCLGPGRFPIKAGFIEMFINPFYFFVLQKIRRMSISVRHKGRDSCLWFDVNELIKAAQENKVTGCVNVHRSSNSIRDVSQEEKEKRHRLGRIFPWT